MIASHSIFYDIEHFIVHSPVEFSDHCLISVYMKSVIQREITTTQKLTYTGHYKWDENQCDSYKDALLEKDSIDCIIYLNSLLDNDKFDDINVLVSKMHNIYLNAASKTLIYARPRGPNNKIKKAKPQKPWMSNNCLLLRRELRSLGKKLQKDHKNIWTRITYCNCVREYNKLKKHLKHQLFSSFIFEINNIAPRDSKQFWQSLRKIKKRQTVSSNSISESEWVEYYKSLLDNYSSDLTRAEPNLGTAQAPSSLDFPFNCSEIKKGIK
jgi:hypothetical protein